MREKMGNEKQILRPKTLWKIANWNRHSEHFFFSLKSKKKNDFKKCYTYLERVEDVQLRECDGSVSVDLSGPFEKEQIEPSTASLPACRHSHFLSDLLQSLPFLVQQLRREGTRTNASLKTLFYRNFWVVKSRQ